MKCVKQMFIHTQTYNQIWGLHTCFHHSQVTDLNSRLHSVEERSRSEREELLDQLHRLSAENASAKLDNQRLKVPSNALNESPVPWSSYDIPISAFILNTHTIFRVCWHHRRRSSKVCSLKPVSWNHQLKNTNTWWRNTRKRCSYWMYYKPPL